MKNKHLYKLLNKYLVMLEFLLYIQALNSHLRHLKWPFKTSPTYALLPKYLFIKLMIYSVQT